MKELPDLITPELFGKLELLRLHTRKQFYGQRQGRHLSRRKGLGIEFADYRKYELGDNPRHIDWGMYGRSDKLYVKTFREEEDISILILLDGSPSMRTSLSGNKWKRAQALALSLAYVGLLGRDRVALHVPGLLQSSFTSHPAAIYQLGLQLRELEQKVASQDALVHDFQTSLQRLKFPGLLFFLSDFLFDTSVLSELVKLTRAKSIDASFLAILAKEDTTLDGLPGDFVAEDSESGSLVECSRLASVDGEYSHLSEQHFLHVESILHNSGFRFSILSEELSFAEYLFKTLPGVGIFSV